MGARGLIDTGAILAFLDRDDRWHERCVQALSNLRFPLATSAAVLAELFHLLRNHPRQKGTAWNFVRSAAVTVLAIDDADLPALEALMRRHADRPMDFADATLVSLAERERLSTIFTLDHDDFETYRIEGRRRFHIVPGR
ncbi:MAG TPA: PIN domain-containing protein [Geminicoccaceae bacterium]|jgi:predicted nucleic acid-binding protein|nr:PIN domain-containing protein [Geminicoccaceae bacterium]